MADNCIAVNFDLEDNAWYYCWESGTPDLWAADNTKTGLRRGLSSGSRAWRTCQYYLNGLPSICKHWAAGGSGYRCNFVQDSRDPNAPSGFNAGLCDNLGRRSWCDTYEAIGDPDPNEWICAAPNGYITGLGHRAEGYEAPLVRLLSRNEIDGYNDDGSGVGRCDCYGMGRGAAGCAFVGEGLISGDSTAEKKLMELPVVCNYYRPWSMGFGAIEPRPHETIDEALEHYDEPLNLRLPLSIELYNHRAQFQKCNFWDADYGSKFILYANTIIVLEEMETDSIFDSEGRIKFCECTETDADPYNHRLSNSTSADFMIGLVQAKDGGLICNGARPECPCYTSSWLHCTREKMDVGMPVTANQILELRFWLADWETRKQYDAVFEQRQNFDDANTSDIYTFTKWKSNAALPTMIGKRLNLCFPIPFQNKEFTRESIFVESPITYAPLSINTGTNTSNQRIFPTLIRNDEYEEIRTFLVGYPYFSDSDITAECDDADTGRFLDDSGHVKRNNDILGDYTTMIGQGIRNKKVYALNNTGLGLMNNFVRDYRRMFTVPPALRDYVTSKLISSVYGGISAGSEYFVTGSCDSIFGVYVLPELKLVYNTTNEILIMIDFGDGKWDFTWRNVNSLWCGGSIIQTKYDHTYTDNGVTNTQPLRISPAAEIELYAEGINGCEIDDVFSTYSFEVADPTLSINYFSYSIVKLDDTARVEAGNSSRYAEILWGPLGGSNFILAEINETHLNYIFEWEFVSAKLTPSEDKKKELEKKGIIIDEIPLKEFLFDDNDAESTIDRFSVPPNFLLLHPIENSRFRMKFLPKDWNLEIKYEYEEMINEDPAWSSGEVQAGAGKTDNDKYKDAPYSIGLLGNWVYVNDVSTGPVNLMAIFSDTDGRPISTMATKACANIVRESCRNLEIYYKYEALGKKSVLTPEKGFCITDNGIGERALSEPFKHIEAPNCGDHDYNPYTWEGPMWFPYNVCRGYDLYDEFTVCNNCQTGYHGPINGGVVTDSQGSPVYIADGRVLKRNDYRYCGPYKFEAFGETRGSFAAACDCGCTFSYSNAENASVLFIGSGKIREPVNLLYYEEQGWTPPPFGNEGRELIEKFISNDYIDHIYYDSGGAAKTRSEWMPMVMDNAAFHMTFNAFDQDIENNNYALAGGLDSFYYVNQMNFFALSNINESVIRTPAVLDSEGIIVTPEADKRFRWDELFEIHQEVGCTYPLPTYPAGNKTKVIFYYFKPNNYTWAWQEYWRDIERDKSWTIEEALGAVEETVTSGSDAIDYARNMLNNSGRLEFINSYERPKYVFSYYKEEHRLIADEGDHYVTYTAPILDEERNIIVNATLAIDNAYSRPFEIFYGGDVYSSDSYNSSQIKWLDEGGESNRQASAKKDNIYEKANGGDWLHDRNTLFVGRGVSSSTSTAGSVVTAVDEFTGTETIKYYNPGVILNITKDRLDFLPKDEKIFNYVGEGSFEEQGGGDNPESLSVTATEEYVPDDENRLLPEGTFVWENDVLFTYYNDDLTASMNLYAIEIIGNWGRKLDFLGKKVLTYMKPSVAVTLQFENGQTAPPRTMNSLPDEAEYYTRLPNDATPFDNLQTYKIIGQFLLGPIEMIKNRIVGFNISLEGGAEPEEFISIESLKLTTVEYSEKRTEVIKVWERKYLASSFNNSSDFNLDTSDNLRSSTDGYNAGLYFPFKGAGDISRPEEEIFSFNKTKAVSAGLYYSSSEEVEISYDTLHEIESTEQKRLYEFATELDESGDDWTYTGIVPYRVAPFLESIDVEWKEREAQYLAEILPWEKHSKVVGFKQYDFWRPGGHRYEWNLDDVDHRKCMLFGGLKYFITARFIHVDHTGIGTPLGDDGSTPIDPGNSYYSLRFYTQVAKYDRAQILAGGDPGELDLWSVGGASITSFAPAEEIQPVPGG